MDDLIDGDGERRKGLKQMHPIAGDEIGFCLFGWLETFEVPWWNSRVREQLYIFKTKNNISFFFLYVIL